VSGLRLLAAPTAGQVDALRETLRRAARLPLYAEVILRAGVTAETGDADPVASLQRLPLFAPEMQGPLARQALAQRRHDLGGVELSSGTAGPPKRRILSEEDLALDAALLTRLLHHAGVVASDRVAAVELAVTPLAAAFLDGCERLGGRDSTALAWRPGADLAPLQRLAPSVLIAPPSLLDDLAPSLRGVRLVIYNGDRLSDRTSASLRAAGAGVRSLYGLTETSALGVSCRAGSAIHLAPEHALFELRRLEADDELVVSTLGFSMPLLRYPTGDRVRAIAGACACGSSWPRVAVLGRLGTRFALFEVETSVDELRAYLLAGTDAPLEITLDDLPSARVVLTLVLPAETRPCWRALRTRLRAHPQLGYLLVTGIVRLRFRIQTPAAAGRKRTPLLDRRGAREAASAC